MRVDLHKALLCQIISHGPWWLTAAQDGSIKVWNADSWRLERSFVAHCSNIIQIITKTDETGRVIVLSHSQDGRIFSWSLDSGEVLFRNCVPGYGDFKMLNRRGQSRG